MHAARYWSAREAVVIERWPSSSPHCSSARASAQIFVQGVCRAHGKVHSQRRGAGEGLVYAGRFTLERSYGTMQQCSIADSCKRKSLLRIAVQLASKPIIHIGYGYDLESVTSTPGHAGIQQCPINPLLSIFGYAAIRPGPERASGKDLFSFVIWSSIARAAASFIDRLEGAVPRAPQWYHQYM